jgi:hypothetical protein
MLTGWFWVDQTYLKKLPSDIQSQYIVDGTDYLNEPGTTVHQLVWWIQNQWGSSFGYNGSFPMAASFFMVTDSSGKVTFKVLPIQSLTYLEVNACAGNFFPAAKGPSAHHVDLMLAHRRSVLSSGRSLYKWEGAATRYVDDYVVPHHHVMSKMYGGPIVVTDAAQAVSA